MGFGPILGSSGSPIGIRIRIVVHESTILYSSIRAVLGLSGLVYKRSLVNNAPGPFYPLPKYFGKYVCTLCTWFPGFARIQFAADSR